MPINEEVHMAKQIPPKMNVAKVNTNSAFMPGSPLSCKWCSNISSSWKTHCRLSYAQSGLRMHYWRTNSGAEVDLVLEKHGKPVAAIGIKYATKPDAIRFKGLAAFQSENPGFPAFVGVAPPNPPIQESVFPVFSAIRARSV